MTKTQLDISIKRYENCHNEQGHSSRCGGKGAKDKSKGEAREITYQQDRRIDLEVCRSWLSVVLYSSSGPFSRDESPE
jgi:hypothetical protein